MLRSLSRLALFLCLLLSLGFAARGGLTSYTDRGKTDFDTTLVLLNPYGTWSKINNAWAYTPLDHYVPYTHGEWIYTEYGWYWKGDEPHSWVTEHYGYWKRGGDHVWSWYPGPYWLPEIVEIRATSTHIGWRSAAVDRDGDFIEQPTDRWAKADEWTFVTRAQFAGPLTPEMAVNANTARQLLDDSTESRHTYFTYRAIDRPGPHPADFIGLGKNGGIFAPITLQDELALQPTPTPISILPSPVPIRPMTGTNGPVLLDVVSADPNADKRKVKYWITMSLPTYWSQRPPEAKAEETYVYRPDFYQDEDGIARRISLWFNPNSRTTLQEVIGSQLPSLKSDADHAPSAAPKSEPFHSPLDDSYPTQSGPAPSTRKSESPSSAPGGLIPPPVGTNAAPANPH
ncbi:MAG: hypothetical protein LV479_07725 [Methylacidiphilales bacterium]|nr:hypothetical protein [Candidatus Methylacidiphilales bacterium]